MRRNALTLCVLSLIATPALAQEQICQPVGHLVSLAQLPEASGIAAGRGAGAPLFAINDSGDPVLTLLDRSGKVVHQTRVTGVRVTDWEDVSVGPCGNGTCVYVADIGDNGRDRRSVTILRLQQPSPAAGTVAAETVELVYPDGPHDAEAVFITPDARLFVVTKENRGAVVYGAPNPLRDGGPGKLTPVARVDTERVTDADTSPDGRWTALRTNNELLLFRTADLVAGRTGDAIRVDLRALKEPQGEGVTFGADGQVYLVSEGGGGRRPGTFATLQCRLP